MSIVENIIATAPITFDDNYQTRLRERRIVLNWRREKLSRCNNRGSIGFENGMAARFYPNIHYRKDFKRLARMIAEIDKELRQIEKFL